MKKEDYEELLKNYPDLVDFNEMRKMLGNIGKSLAYSLLKDNKIKHLKIGNLYKIPKIYIIQFLVENDSSENR